MDPRLATIRTAGDLVEPTEGERANGWTAESLTAYLRAREREREQFLGDEKAQRRAKAPAKCQNDFDPFKW